MSGIQEPLGTPGRKQYHEACPATNLVLQKPEYFLAPTSLSVVGEPFAIQCAIAAGANAAHTVYTVPTGWEVTILDCIVTLAGAGVASSTATLLNASNILFTAVATTGSDGAILRPTAGWADHLRAVAAGSAIKVYTTGGISAPALLVTILCMRTPA